MTSWLDDVFAVQKPVIAMLHLAALPGDPGFDSAAGIRAVVDRAKEELAALQEVASTASWSQRVQPAVSDQDRADHRHHHGAGDR